MNRAGQAPPPLGFRALDTAVELIRESELKEKVRYSQGTVEQWDPQSMKALEQDIEADLRALREQFVGDQARGVVLDVARSSRSRR